MRNRIRFLSMASLIATLYILLTFFSALWGLDRHIIQLRLSEMLCILPYFTSAAIPGLWIGCFLSNLLIGCTIWDIVFGSLATLFGAIGGYFLGRIHKMFVPLPTILCNTLLLPLVMIYSYGAEQGYFLLCVMIGIGELLSAGLLGMMLMTMLSRYPNLF